MAFQKNDVNSNNNDTSWKATAFINLYVPTADGQSRRKIGAIALRDSKKLDAALIKRLLEDGGVQALADNLQIDFQMADSGEETELGF